MKALLLLFFLLFVALTSSCRHGGNTSGEGEENADEAYVDTLPKATVILWVDKKNSGGKRDDFPNPVRTVKVKANIRNSGRVEILSYVKPQKDRVRNYLKQRLEVFRVSRVMLDSGFVKPGVQYVQLRYMPEKLR